MKLKAQKVDGHTIALTVEDDGTFVAECGGDEWRDPTLAGVIAKARRDLRRSKVRIAIPATAIGVELHTPKYGKAHGRQASGKVRHLTITGVHGRTGNILVRWEDTNEHEQISGWRSEGELCRRLTPNEIREYATLAAAKKNADAALEKFERAVKLGGRTDIRQFIAEQVRQAEDAPKEPDTDESEDPR